jgi:hypothetical protein
MGTAVTGDGLHEAEAPSPIMWICENAKLSTKAALRTPRADLGVWHRFPSMPPNRKGGGNPATEMPCWEEAADVANRRGD